MIIHNQFSQGRRQLRQNPVKEWVPFDQIIGGPVSQAKAEVVYLRPECGSRTEETTSRHKPLKLKLGTTKAGLWVMTVSSVGLLCGILMELGSVL